VVLLTVARIRETSAHLALSRSRDLGEAVVIAHAKVLADAGHQACVVIDDQDGQTLATMEGLAILAVEDLLLAAVQLGLLAPERLRKAYEDLIPFGSGLPSWDASTLKKQFRQWRQTQVQPVTTNARLAVGMRTVTATEAARHFSDLLEAVERGETVTIVRGRHPVAEIGPARRRTGADLRAALTGTLPPDDAFAKSIGEAISMVTTEVGHPKADT
jgi:prevent-host-death family protein